MSSFKLLPLDDEKPLGNNNLNAKAMYYQRSKYMEYIIPNILEELVSEDGITKSVKYGFIDVNSDGKNYGKINLKNEYIILDLANEKNNASRLINNNFIRASDFVLSQVSLLIQDYNNYFSFKQTRNSPFKTLALASIFSNHQTEYINSQQSLLETFRISLNLEEVRRSLKTEKDLYENIKRLMKEYAKVRPITKIGFISSNLYHESKTGLCINTLLGVDHSDDLNKYDQFVSDQYFKYYVDILRQRGFVVDSNIPWRFFIDFNNKYTLDNLKKFSINSLDQLFEERYVRADRNDIDNLITYISQFFEIYTSTIKTNTELKLCKNNIKVKFFDSKIKKINRQQLLEVVGYSNVVKLYMDLRFLETNKSVDEITYNKILKTFLEIKTYKNENEALYFLNDTLRDLTP
jgi:hypothetical protein